MRSPKRSTAGAVERYDLAQSPFAQNPTQKKFAELLGFKKAHLEALATHKDKYITRRTIIDEGKKKKVRNLAYPFSKLRSVHEKLKFHLNKIKQPEYMYSPRKGRSQRDNALRHTDQIQYLKLDIKQFYPSTTSEHIYRWARYELGMRDDVAGLFTHLVTVDGAASFGSPLTPVMCTLVHRKMFDKIADECHSRGLKITLWVDDIAISGNFIPGVLINIMREIVRSHGLKTHKLCYSTGSRHVEITGIMIKGNKIDAPITLHKEIEEGYLKLNAADSSQSVETSANKLLSMLGRYRYIVGRSSELGRTTSNRMNHIRQSKNLILSRFPITETASVSHIPDELYYSEDDAPF